MNERIKEKIGKVLQNNDLLYCIYKMAFSKRGKDYQQLLKAYIDTANVLQFRRYGNENYGKTVYRISVGYEHSNISAEHTGFFAMLRMNALERLALADACGFVPYIEWGPKCLYAEEHPVNGTTNVFEYYFEQVSDLSAEEINTSAAVIESTPKHGRFIYEQECSMYATNESEIDTLACIYRKYIHLNSTTKKYIDENISHVLQGKNILGIHVRGTDFKIQLNKHPVVITIDDYLFVAQKLWKTGKYDQIFLATDDSEAVKRFTAVFGNSMSYYADIKRSEGSVSLALLDSERENHHYMLGLEVLRDVYTLASCDGFIGNLSQVSVATRICKCAKNIAFLDEVILDKGINQNGADWASVYKQQVGEKRK